MDWQRRTPTDAEIQRSIDAAKRTGRGVTVGPTWLEEQLHNLRKFEAASRKAGKYIIVGAAAAARE